MRTRQEAREAARVALEAMGLFQKVFKAPVRKLGGISPVAMVWSAGSEPIGRAPGLMQTQLQCRLYMRSETGDEEATEDAFDAMTATSIEALRVAGFALAGPTTAQPDGGPLRSIDGVLYRCEQMTLKSL